MLLQDGRIKLGEGSYHQAGDGRWHVPDPTLNNDARTQLDLTYQEGKDASFTLSVRNDGDDPVTLVGASVLGANAMFARRSVRFAATPAEPRSVKPGRTVTIPPGKEAAVVYTGRFTHCGMYGPGSTAFTDELTVLYGDAAKPKRVEIPLRENVSIAAPRHCSEPREP